MIGKEVLMRGHTHHVDAPRLLFAAGGTGGHIFPALAVADKCRELMPTSIIEFVGTKGRLEEKVIPRAGYPINYLTISGLERKLSIRALSLPAKLAISLTQSLRLIARFRPDVIVCAGAYVSYPIGIAASIRNVPLVLMESNAYPGLVTRRLAPKAAEVHVAFQQAAMSVRCKRVFVSGNPVRSVFQQHIDKQEARAHFGLTADAPTLFVFGGSLGARSINDAMDTCVDQLQRDGVQVIWQTGSGYAGDEVKSETMYRTQFIHEMELGYAAADLVVARAGATTAAELLVVAKPSVLVPLPIETVHQRENAEALRDIGASLMVLDHEVTEKLYDVVSELLRNPTQLTSMSKAAANSGVLDADEKIAGRVLELATD